MAEAMCSGVKKEARRTVTRKRTRNARTVIDVERCESPASVVRSVMIGGSPVSVWFCEKCLHGETE